MNRASKSLLKINTESGKSNQVTPTKIRKIELDKDNKKEKEEMALDPCVNKRPCLKMKEINTFNNEQLMEDSVSTSKERSAKVDKAKPVKINKSRSVEAKPVKTINSKSVKAKSVKSHSKKSHSTNCCSNNTCISKFFGFECPKLKNNRLYLLSG